MGTGFSKKKKEARQMQEQFTKMKESIENAEATGSASNGLVTITLSGNHNIKNVVIKPECVDPDDIEGLELLIKAAHNDATEQLEKQSMQQMGGNLSGFSGFPF